MTLDDSEGIDMDNSEIKQQQNPGSKKPYSAPRLVSYGSVAQLTKTKSGKQSDTNGGKNNNLPPIRRY